MHFVYYYILGEKCLSLRKSKMGAFFCLIVWNIKNKTLFLQPQSNYKRVILKN